MNDILTDRQQAQLRIASHMDPSELEAVERIKAMNAYHVGSARDAELRTLYKRLFRNTQTETAKLAGIVVTGSSGSGKTHLIRSMETHPAFQRFRMPGKDYDNLPYISIDAPPKCAPNYLLAEIVKACGFPVSNPGNVAEMRDLAMKWFALRGVMFLHIDEFQHAQRSNTETQIKEIQDAMKMLVQISAPWPVQLILSGTPVIADFRTTSPELEGRTLPFDLESLDPAADGAVIEKVVTGIITKHAQLEVADLDEKEFVMRLSKAANHQFGNVIQTIRLACEEVILEGRTEVGIQDFVKVYSMLVGSRNMERNLFVSSAWRDLQLPKRITNGKAFTALKKKREKTFAVRGKKLVES
ncbi:hypothetical protein CN071_11905 [Sinorhizobium meliloti]|uniref:ATP-binding protein n=1 Tax=Rhizobium meliloti TaxID=382 RepID=UPI000FD595FC|nr:ATP-binding protein [Sinorhizobium meliloti]MQX41883.1 AAA family ATPase [Sinorhizobium meliloti]MQX71489.1 AAA family ATPase [Sinorhizobium meliloti]MQX93835.1 AAA family ATPase [Sinorhizobium meliloti]RVG68117.1 hypothetical protein CN220_20140 [Sinorhizobium meliloti]RVH38921.1 hypothetical protein CN212_34285 [Sinorhizobium meliloti]